MKTSDILKKRGIYEQALQANWKEAKGHWEYPIYGLQWKIIGTRAKRYPNIEGQKYWWVNGKPNNPDAEWYILKGTIEAIKEAEGVAWLSNGEPALLAYHAGGVKNVIATTLSEVAVPQNVVNYLNRLGISRLIYIVDSDEAGRRSAVNWRDALAGSGIDFEARAWPESCGAKADANDAWISCQFDKQAFQAILHNSYRNTLILPKPEKKSQAPKSFPEFDKSSLVNALHQALDTGNYLRRRVHQGLWQECLCPFHDDKNPSAGFNLESGVLHCMASCGKAYSPKELAERLGVDWKAYYPKPEGKKKATKANFSAYAKQLEELAKPNPQYLSHEAAIMAEVARLTTAYNAGIRILWYEQRHLPIAFLSAILNLCSGRSSAVVLLGKMHEALLSGDLPPLYTLPRLAEVVGMRLATVRRDHFELEQLGLVSFLVSLKDSSLAPDKSTLSSITRPTALYAIEYNESEFLPRLKDMLSLRVRERHTRRAMSELTGDMALQLGLNDEKLRAWQERSKPEIESKYNKSANRAVKAEMDGDGLDWRGWTTTLDNLFAIPIDWHTVETSRQLRGVILTYWISNIRARNSREELQRLLGCSGSVIDAIFEEYHIVSEPQTYKIEMDFFGKTVTVTHGKKVLEAGRFKPPVTVSGMQTEFNRLQRELRGKIWKGGFQATTEEGWQVCSDKSYLNTYSRLRGVTKRVYFLINTPSVQRMMTEDEIVIYEAAKQAELEANQETAGGIAAEAPPQKQVKIEDNEEQIERTYRAHVWDKHSETWLYNQLRLHLFCFTAYELRGHTIIDSNGFEVFASGSLPILAKWLNQNAASYPLRSVAEFYGKDYDELLDLKELQAIADWNFEKAALSNYDENETVESFSDEQLELFLA